MSNAIRQLTIGTRGSPLALIQTGLVSAALTRAHPGLVVDPLRITTKGDILLDRPLSTLGDKGLFVVEIEDAMRDGRVDLAVHSAKDLPSMLSGDMCIAAFPARGDPRDALVLPARRGPALPPGARVGTSSPRRSAQLKALHPDVLLLDARGNVGTRLQKLVDGSYDALILAAVGLERLGVHPDSAETPFAALPIGSMLPAPGQGALAIEVRSDRADLIALVRELNDPATERAVTVERAFLGAVGGGCNSAVAAHATVTGAGLVLRAMIGASDGQAVRGEVSGPAETGVLLAHRLARDLMERGGAEFLRAVADVVPH